MLAVNGLTPGDYASLKKHSIALSMFGLDSNQMDTSSGDERMNASGDQDGDEGGDEGDPDKIVESGDGSGDDVEPDVPQTRGKRKCPSKSLLTFCL